MNRRTLIVLCAVITLVAVSLTLGTVWAPQSDPLGPDQTYPTGAEPTHINFSALSENNTNVSHTPRNYWDSYAIIYTAPPERRLVEGNYYINSSTGEIIAERWHGAKVYRNGSIYAFVQPADRIPNEYQRDEFQSDPTFVYQNASDAYYRYDPHYGQLAPTNIGRHTAILDAYRWKAVNTTNHHGVAVITYQVTGTRTGTGTVPPAINGTLQLGADDGIIYSYDVTLDGEQSTYHYTYNVKPASFPEHEWVNTARNIVANTSDIRSDR